MRATFGTGQNQSYFRRHIMTIGTGIALLVIGAILVFAVNVDVQYVDLDLIGYILMGAGGVVILLGLIFMMTRRGRSDLPLE